MESLREEVSAWLLAHDARMYVDELRERLPELDDEDRARVAAWCDWAEAWADRSDPTVNVVKIVGLKEVEAPFWWGATPQHDLQR